MRIGGFLLSAWLLRGVRAETSAVVESSQELSQDVEDFWHRFVSVQTDMSLPPTEAPALTPTNPGTTAPSPSILTPRPTPRPTIPPISAPPSLGPGTCKVEVMVGCMTASTTKFPDGRPCNEIVPPSLSCSGSGPIGDLKFIFEAAPCNQSRNEQSGIFQCQDTAPFPNASEPVVVECIDTGAAVTLNVAPVVVRDGDIFTVSNAAGAPLPVMMTCFFTNGDGLLIQTNTLDVSGTVDLQLNDRFGGMVLKSCDEKDCVEKLIYSYNLINAGSDATLISLVNRTLSDGINNVNDDLVSFVDPNPIPLGENAGINDEFTIDICEGSSYELDIEVGASSPDGITCSANGEYDFTVPPPPTPIISVAPTPRPSPGGSPRPTPVLAPTLPFPTSAPGSCAIDLTIACHVEGDECTAIPPAVTVCTDRPTALNMLLVGGDCSESHSVQVNRPDKFACTDVDPTGVPKAKGTRVYVVATASKDPTIVYTSQYVAVGDNFTVSDGGQKLETEINVTIYSSDAMGPDTQLQTLKFHSSCSQDLYLNDRFGAVELIGFVNEEQGVVSSFTNATVELIATIPLDIPDSGLTLTSYFAVTNVGIFNFTDDVYGKKPIPDTTVRVSFQMTVDLAQPRRYTILAEMSGVTDTGEECDGSAFYNFATGTDVSEIFPSGAPALTPTAELPEIAAPSVG